MEIELYSGCKGISRRTKWFICIGKMGWWDIREWWTEFFSVSDQIRSVSQSCPPLCDPMNCSTPGPPVLSPTPGVHSNSASIESVMPSSRLILCCPLLLLPPIPPSIRVFPVSQLFAWGGQSTGVSALASFFPKNTQDWSPLGWTGWISLQSKGLSRVFPNTTVQKHQFFSNYHKTQ